MATYGDPRLPTRFWRKVRLNQATGCWEWTASRTRGYGQFVAGKGLTRLAHRYAYLTLVGSTDLPLDHLCRVTCCVNPDHLEPTTDRVNLLRGVSPNVLLHLADTCTHGHDLTQAYIKANGTRQCRECAARIARDRYKAFRTANPLPPRILSETCRKGHIYAETGCDYNGPNQTKRTCAECRRIRVAARNR